MKILIKYLLAYSAAMLLVACGGGGTEVETPVATYTPAMLSSASVDGVSISPGSSVVVKNGQRITITMSGAVNFSATSKLSGATTPTVLSITSLTSTVWSASINSAPGAVTTLVVSDAGNSTVIATFTFNIQSAYQGTWSGNYTGADIGTCSAIVVNTLGSLSGSCVSTIFGSTTSVSGNVSATGASSFVSGGTSTGTTFTGTFSTTTASGTWVNTGLGINGTWSATKP